MKNSLHVVLKLLLFTTIMTSISPHTLLAQEAVTASARVAQNRTDDFPAPEKRSLKETLKFLETGYQVSFNYDNEVLADAYVPETFSWSKKEKLEKVLGRLLQSFQLTFQRIDKSNYLILSKEKAAHIGSIDNPVGQPSSDSLFETFASKGARAPQLTIKHVEFLINGVVLSESGEPLPGVNILLKGTSLGTSTDAKGAYAISLPEGSGTLVFTFIGYLPVEEAINNRSTIDVTLQPDVKTLSEVIVVGYGSQEQKDVTGAIGTISGDKLKSSPVSSVDQALQGRMSGVYVTTNSGEPGGGLSVRVRGMGGFGVSEPLYVIDGVIITYSSSSGSSNPLATLNMADIESINVLKDASASAIYGARAGNGVVIIVTKHGKIGKPKLTFDSYVGFQQVAKELPMMNASDYAQFSNDARTAAGLGTSAKFANPESLGAGTNWQKEIFRTAPQQNYQLSLSGGSEKSQYYVSAGYMKQQGIIIGSSFDRYSLRLNLDNQATSWLKIGNNITLSRTMNQSLTNNNGDRYAGIVAQALRRSPTLGVYTADGGWAGPDASDLPYVGTINNPVMLAKLNNEPNERIRALGNMYAEVKILKDLTFRTNFGLDYVLTNFNRFRPKFIEGSLANNKPEAMASKSTLSNVLAENTLTYKKTLGGKHSLEVLAGYTAQLSSYETVSALSFFHTTNEVITIDGGLPDPNRQASGSKSQTSYVSFLGRVNYAYADKYLFTANIRRDGSSVFTSKNKFGAFPSFSVGWRLSEEGFMKDIPAISNLKLRGSWGQVGIDGNLGIGTEYATIGSGYRYNFSGKVVNGMMSNRVPNSSLKWETVTQTDVGLDLALLQNRVTFTADYFVKRYGDMITQKRIPVYAGMVSDEYYENSISQPVNSGTVENKGLELSLNYQNSSPKGFTYNFGVNVTTFSNKVVKLQDDIIGGSTGNSDPGFLTRTKQGRSVGEFFGYKTNGIFKSQEEVSAANALQNDPTKFFQSSGTAPGDIRYTDINGDNKIDDNDRAYLGSPIPKFAYGFNASIEFKRFDLNLLFQGVYGNKLVNVNRYITESSTDQENKSAAMVGRWSAANPNSNFPRAISTDPNNNDRASDRFIESGSYLRLRNISLGYTLPTSLISRLSLASVRFYVSAQNLWTITKYSGYNPDIGAQAQNNTNNGIDNTIYPSSVTVLGGVSIGF